MTENALIGSFFGNTKIAVPLEIAALRALYEADFFHREEKSQNQRFSRPSDGRLHCCGRQLTETEDEETIIINRPDRSTYLEEKSVSRSGATPDL